MADMTKILSRRIDIPLMLSDRLRILFGSKLSVTATVHTDTQKQEATVRVGAYLNMYERTQDFLAGGEQWYSPDNQEEA